MSHDHLNEQKDIPIDNEVFQKWKACFEKIEEEGLKEGKWDVVFITCVFEFEVVAVFKLLWNLRTELSIDLELRERRLGVLLLSRRLIESAYSKINLIIAFC